MNQKSRFPGGFRLTYSTIGSIIKYPCESLASEGSKGAKHRKKYGYFKIDEKIFLDVAQELNMISENIESRIVYKRHPFVYLVEAADDICYNIIDFEDAHRLGILPFETVKSMFLDVIKYDEETQPQDLEFKINILKDDHNETIAYLRSKAINILTRECADKFWENKDLIIAGDYNSTLMDDLVKFKGILKQIETVSVRSIYNARNVVELEIAGFRIMSGLVKDFVTSALTAKEQRDKEQKKIMELLPNQFKFDETSTPYVKVMHILDFISGMTDLFALKLYRKLRGIEI